MAPSSTNRSRHDPSRPVPPVARNGDPGVGEADLRGLQGGPFLGDLGLGHPVLGALGLELGLGRIQLRLGGDLLLSKLPHPLQLTLRDLQCTAAGFELGTSHVQLRPGLGHLLGILALVQDGHELLLPDPVPHVHQKALEAAPDLRGHEKLGPGVEGACEKAHIPNRFRPDGLGLHGHGPGPFATGLPRPCGGDLPVDLNGQHHGQNEEYKDCEGFFSRRGPRHPIGFVAQALPHPGSRFGVRIIHHCPVEGKDSDAFQAPEGHDGRRGALEGLGAGG